MTNLCSICTIAYPNHTTYCSKYELIQKEFKGPHVKKKEGIEMKKTKCIVCKLKNTESKIGICAICQRARAYAHMNPNMLLAYIIVLLEDSK